MAVGEGTPWLRANLLSLVLPREAAPCVLLMVLADLCGTSEMDSHLSAHALLYRVVYQDVWGGQIAKHRGAWESPGRRAERPISA